MHFVLDLANVVNLPLTALFNPVRQLTGVDLEQVLEYTAGFVLWMFFGARAFRYRSSASRGT